MHTYVHDRALRNSTLLYIIKSFTYLSPVKFSTSWLTDVTTEMRIFERASKGQRNRRANYSQTSCSMTVAVMSQVGM